MSQTDYLRKAEESKNKLLKEAQTPSERNPFRKGRNYHLWDNTKYDVDTFYDELAWEIITLERGLFRWRIYFYTKSDWNCPSCQQSQDVVFNIQSTGVVMKCLYCNLTTLAPPCDVSDNGSEGELAELLQNKEVSIQEALAIMQRTGQDTRPFEQYLPRDRPDRKRHIHNKEEEKGGA